MSTSRSSLARRTSSGRILGIRVLSAVLCYSLLTAVPEAGGTDFAKLRQQMVERQIRQRGVADACVLAAMERVPRELFVPDGYRAQAYEDRPLPIGEGQTISQPYIVAVMSEAARLSRDDRVLEIGTGSGYHAAILAECAAEVFTVEIKPDLARSAESRLRELGHSRVSVRHGDGRAGWPEHAPYDAIVVTAAGPEVPPALVEQLAEGGRLVMPRRTPGGDQVLVVATKQQGRLKIQELMPVAFVPLVEP
jgi:protein-L-isoaspartate(D-aspartate) O-methyltransferase